MVSISVRLAPVLAHAGGWDEMLLGATPIVVIIGVLALVKRRAVGPADETVAEHDEPDGFRAGR